MPKVNRTSRTFLVASWIAVVLMLVVIFWFSSQDGTTLNEDLGGISALKVWLALMASQALGHPVDVSPIGHFTEYLFLGVALANALNASFEAKGRSESRERPAQTRGNQDSSTQIHDTRLSDPDKQTSKHATSASKEGKLAKWKLSGWKLVAMTATLASLYGATDEFHQIFTPGRSCDPADWLVDTIAALIGAFIVALILRR